MYLFATLTVIDFLYMYMISEFESGLGLIEVLSICFEVSSSSLRQVMDYQFPPLMGPGRRATFGKCQLQQKFSFLIRWTFKLFVAIFCFGERNSKIIIESSKMDQMHPDFHFRLCLLFWWEWKYQNPPFYLYASLWGEQSSTIQN